MKHRQEDSQRLLQRNTNLLKDMMNKQNQEQRRTTQFLKFALGKRETRSDEEIKDQMKNSSYLPQNDPLMQRINRKYNPMASQTSILSRMRLNTQDSRMTKGTKGTTVTGSFMIPSEFKSPSQLRSNADRNVNRSLINKYRMGAATSHTGASTVTNATAMNNKINRTTILEQINSEVADSYRGKKPQYPLYSNQLDASGSYQIGGSASKRQGPSGNIMVRENHSQMSKHIVKQQTAQGTLVLPNIKQ